MNLAQTASVCVLIACTGATWEASQARAEDQWTAGSPVFKSEVEQRERELNAQRAEARKSYNVAYPKFMDGGEKPPITPEKPPVVYLEKNEPPGMIIVDTGGAQHYFPASPQPGPAPPTSP